MKKTIYILTFLMFVTLSVFGQSAYNFNPNNEYQFLAASADGEVYGIKFNTSQKKVDETILIDLKTNKSRKTVYDENGLPQETYQNDKLYVYDNDNGEVRLVSDNEYENQQLMKDAQLLKSQGINLGFMDKMVLDNSNWLEKLSQNKKYLDLAVITVSYCETGLACLGTGVNPMLAIPCATGLVNLMGQNYNTTNPELSGTMDVVSGDIGFLHDYVVDGKVIDGWGKAVELINATNSYYNERVAKMHENAERIRASLKEERELKRNQTYEQKSDFEPASLNTQGGIIGKAVAKLDAIDAEIKGIENKMTEMYKSGKLNETIAKNEMLHQKELKDKKTAIKKAAAVEFNDSLKTAVPYSWKKTDGEGYYAINGLKFTGIRWNEYDDMPYANFEVGFSARMKPKYVKIFDEMKMFETYMMNLGFQWYDKKMKLTDGLLIVNKDMRAAGKLTFALRWFDFLNTPVIKFNKSDFRTDYSMPQK